MGKRAAIIFVTIGIILVLIPNVKAAPAEEGWVLIDVIDQGPDDVDTEIHGTGGRKIIQNYHYNKGAFSIDWDIEWSKSAGGFETIGEGAIDIKSKNYRTQGTVSAVFTGFPERIAPGETATLEGSFSREIRGDDTDTLATHDLHRTIGPFVELNAGLENLSKTNFTVPALSNEQFGGKTEHIPITFPQGQEGDIVVIRVGVPGKRLDPINASFIDNMSSTFKYEYHENAPPSFGPVTQTEDGSPKDHSGEETTDIKTAAILGIAATIAAVVAASASAAGSSATASATVDVSTATQDAAGETARQKTGDYRMVVYKSFGDTIHHGKTDEYVVARIEYKDEQTGTWVFDVGRSDAISITISQVKGLGLYPPPLNLTVPGKGYTIMLDNKEPEKTQATLSFKFTAPDGGFFQRNMVFQLLGAPHIWLDSNKIWFLEGDYDPFDLKCRLLGYDPVKYDIDLDGMDSFVTLEMDKNAQGEDVIRVIPVQGVYDDWDKRDFIYSYPCLIAYKDKQTLDRISEVKFTVNLCYEGIGSAMSDPQKSAKINELFAPFELWAYSDSESYRRTEEKFQLALTVARWDNKKRILEYDTAAAKTLELSYSVDLSSDRFKTESAKIEAMRVLKDAAPRVECLEIMRKAEGTYRIEMKPAFFTTITTNETESGLAPFPILLTVSLPGSKYSELVLKGIFNPMSQWEDIVRWFFGVPAGTFASTQMRVGDPDLYVEALEFIGNRVYSFRNVPFAPSSSENHYEDGVIASTTHKRVRSVVLLDSSIPTGIGDYKKAQSLVHELTHALEHKNTGDTWTLVSSSAEHERHAYFLQYASDAIYELALAERGVNTEENISLAIVSMYDVYFNPNNTSQPRNLSWFGASIPTQHNLFKAYLDRWLQFGTGISGGEVGEVISRNYFPGALKNDNRHYPANFEIQSGKFKGTCFMFSWGNGRLGKFSVGHKDYKFVIKSPLRWTGGFTLQTQLEVIDKITLGGGGTGSVQRGRDTFMVTLTALETFNAENPEYTNITEFSAVWQLKSGNDVHSIAAPDVHGGKMTTTLINNSSSKREHEK